MGNRPEIDGLRGVAVAAVLLYHAGFGCAGGYVGVDVFFVISGYLITSILRSELGRQSFSLSAFWERRLRRLMPALFVVVLTTLIGGGFLLLPDDYRELGQSAVAQALLVANVHFYREADYFAGPSDLKPLLHLWSLAVEEQFYIVLPPLMWVLWRRSSRERAVLFFLCLAGSFAWSCLGTLRSPSAAFYLLPSRAWELLVGVGLACAPEKGILALEGKVAEVVAGLGAAAIAFAVFFYSDATPFPGVAALAPCLGTAAVIAANQRTLTVVGRMLSTRVPVGTGLISYSLYLWHWPLLAFTNYVTIGTPLLAARLLLVIGSVAVAFVSWKLVEQPARQRRVLPGRGRLFSVSLAAMACIVVAGVTLHANRGFRHRFPADVLRMADARRDVNPQRQRTNNLSVASLQKDGLPTIGRSGTPALAILGDSHADAVLPLLEQLCEEFRVSAIAATRVATIPLFFGGDAEDEDNRRFQAAVFQHLKTSPVRHVLLVARWSGHKRQVLNEKNLRRTVEALNRAGKKVWILRQVPEQHTDVPRALALSAFWKTDAAAVSVTRAEYDAAQDRADRLFDAMPPRAVTLIDPATYFFSEGTRCRIESGGRPLYVDDDHLSTFGAKQLRPLFLKLFEEIQRPPADSVP